jgi:predicted Zn-dependent protease
MPDEGGHSVTADVAAQALELATRAMPGAQLEARADRTQSALTRFANSFIHQNMDEDTTTVGLRAHLDGRTVSATTTSGDLSALVDRVAAMLAVAPLDPAWPGLAPPAPLEDRSTVDEATRECPPSARAQRVREFVDAAQGYEAAGYCRTSYWSGSYRNSLGHALDDDSTEAVLDGIARANGADGTARRTGAYLSDVDGAALGRIAAESARSQADPIELPPGHYEVILKPEAVTDLLNNFSYFGFNGRAFAEGRSFAELGAAQFDPAISIHDNPFDGVGGRSFDVEGTPKTRLALVDKGITSAITHDRRTAALAGAESTGHGLPGDNFGPIMQNPALAAGTSTLERMIADTERGVLVADFWYTRVLDPRTLVVTGLTRNGVWLIENGEIVKPLRNFRFTQGYPQALSPGNVLAVGSEVEPQPNRYDLFNSSAPALRLASWNFTGGASG